GGTGVTSFAVNPGDASIAYAATAQGIWKTFDGGRHWHPVNDGLPIGAFDTTYLFSLRTEGYQLLIDPRRPRIVYAGTHIAVPAACCLFKTTNGGASWQHADTGLPRDRASETCCDDMISLAMDPARPSTLYYAGLAD